jgi:putative ABC transport system permease protein
MSKKERELDDEIRSHLDMAVQDRIERGESRADAELAARRELGNVGLVKEVTRDVWAWRGVDRFLQDLRYAARLLRRNPMFTLVAVLSLAIGIGANTAIFQVINAVSLRALPVGEPHTLALIQIADMTGARGNFNSRFPSVTNPIWEQLRRDQAGFSGVLAWNRRDFNVTPGGLARRVRGLMVSGSFFDVLRIQPAAGRLLTEPDDTPGCAPRAVISYRYWHNDMGGRPVVGTTIPLDGHPVEIVGVTSQSFTGVEVGRTFDVAVPICADPALSNESRLNAGTDWWLTVMGRLKPGATFDEASAHLAAISPGVFRATLPAGYPAANVQHYLGFRLEAIPGAAGLSGLREDYADPLTLLLGIAAVVLVIACVNLANLMMARASAREREFAVRLGLGASRGRVVRQLLVESLLLAAIGAVFGSMLAEYLSSSLVAFLDPDHQAVFLDLPTDWRVLGFTILVAMLTCVLFGVAPALRATRISASSVLRATSRGLTASRERFALRRGLVMLQVALSFFLLVGAFLFARTLQNLLTVDPGFKQDGIVIAALDLRPMRTPPAARHDVRIRILERLRGVPGIESAADVAVVPISGNAWGNNVWLDTGGSPNLINALFNRVSPGYFSTLGIPLVAGRDFSESDRVGAREVAIVNRTFVRNAANGGNVVGQRLKLEATPSRPESTFEIVGVVEDAIYLDLRQGQEPGVFFPSTQARQPNEYLQVILRSTLPPGAFSAAVTDAIRDINPEVVVSFTGLKEQILDTLVRERLMAALSGFFGVIAALLAVVGLYGVIAYNVARRTNEIGVRMALGASHRTVLRMILGEAMLLVGVGMAAGAGLAIVGGRTAQTLLFGLEPWDPLTLTVAACVLATVALAASYLPARAAARISPIAALRVE